MEDYETPTLESITAEVDRSVLAEHRGKIQAYGESVVESGELSADKIEELASLASLIDALDARDGELAAAEQAEVERLAAEAAKADAVKAKFAKTETAVVEDVKADKTFKIQVPAAKTHIELPASDEVPTLTAPVAKFNVTHNGAEVSMTELGQILAKTNQAWAGQRFDGSQKFNLFSSKVDAASGVYFGKNAEENFNIFNEKIKPSIAVEMGVQDADALVASGGYCAPLNVDYSIPIYSELCDTVESFYPNVLADRGGIKYMIPPADTTAAGIAVITCLEDKAGYTCETPAGTTPCKPTTTIGCPTQAECCVDMITKSITFGNLNYRTFPELISYAMHQLAVNFNRRKQTYLLDQLFAPANVTVKNLNAAVYNAVHDMFKDIITIAIEYRKDMKMCYGTGGLKLLLPRHVVTLLAWDDLARETPGTGLTSEADVRSFFANHGITVGFYDGEATAMVAADKIPALGTTTTINPLPTGIWALLSHPESYTILNGGTLDLGLVRDSTLNHANNLEFFAEEFLGVCRTGEKGVLIKGKVCSSGSFAAASPKITCP